MIQHFLSFIKKDPLLMKQLQKFSFIFFRFTRCALLVLCGEELFLGEV